MYCYIEIKNKKIISYGQTTSVELALSKTSGSVAEVTEKELALVTACDGNLEMGLFVLENLSNKLDKIGRAHV